MRRLNQKARRTRTKRRLQELREEIKTASEALRDFVSTKELAKLVGRSRRWVTGNANSIPGVQFLKNQFEFRKSTALSEWIFTQRRIRTLNRVHIPRTYDMRPGPSETILWETVRYERTVLRELTRTPISDWPPDERETVLKRLREIHAHIEREIKRQTA